MGVGIRDGVALGESERWGCLGVRVSGGVALG